MNIAHLVDEQTRIAMAEIDRQILAHPDPEARAALAFHRDKILKHVRQKTAVELEKAIVDLDPKPPRRRLNGRANGNGKH
jgi:hypothetical protein